MTPTEFAEAHGLSLEEASYILSRRAALAETGDAKLDRARSILALSQKKVGVHPVTLTSEGLETVYDPDADVGRGRFYEKKDSPAQEAARVVDWEEPP